MSKTQLFENKINHIAILLDASTSMRDSKRQVVKVVDKQVAHLAQRSKDLDQETRVSVYTFSGKRTARCIIYDKDVLRLPSIEKVYDPQGQTALRDAQVLAIDDLLQTPQKYGDHAFFFIAITDGEENDSLTTDYQLRDKIDALPENATVAVLVPDQRGVHEAKCAGFPAGNVAVWDTSKGFEEAGSIVRESTEVFMTNRSRGVRGTKSLFKTVNVDVSARLLANTLNQLRPSEFQIRDVISADWEIRSFVEAVTQQTYVKGQGFYELTKTEEVQDYKLIAILNTNDGAVYIGQEARQLLGIPDTFVKLKPGDFRNFRVFIESTSVNRKLVAGTRVLILRPEVVDRVKNQTTSAVRR